MSQKYQDMAAFDAHCDQDYVKSYFETSINDPVTGVVEDWRCRLFHEED